MNGRCKLVIHALKIAVWTAIWLFLLPCALCTFLYIPTETAAIRVYVIAGSVAGLAFVYQLVRILIHKPKM
jgi:hypothetical protein